jgi:hypothetical protein
MKFMLYTFDQYIQKLLKLSKFTPAVQASENQAISAFTQELAAALRRIERRKSALANPDSVVTE